MRNKIKNFKDNNTIAIQFFLYIDDAEVNNPLRSHCDSIYIFYYSFPVIEDCDINLAAVFKGKDYKEFGNEKWFNWEFNKLEQNGFDINTSEGIKRTYFILGLVLSDNLGLLFLALFPHFCRVSKVKKDSSHTDC